MNKQKYTYTYDNALEAFFVREINSDQLLLTCKSELVAVSFICDLLSKALRPDQSY